MKYKVLKEILTAKNPRWLKPGDIFDGQAEGARIKALLERGYIEEVEGSGLSGQYVPPELGSLYITPDITDIIDRELIHCANYRRGMAGKAASFGLSFKTDEECRDWIKKMRAYQILRRDAKGLEPDWKNYAQKKWSGWYDYDLNMLSSGDTLSCQSIGDICFATEEDVRESFENHRKEWLTVLGVEENEQKLCYCSR